MAATLVGDSPAPAGISSSLSASLVNANALVVLAIAVQAITSYVLCTLAHRPFLVGLGETYGTFWSAIPLYGAGTLAIALVHTRMRHAPSEPAEVGYRVAWDRIRWRVAQPDYVPSVLVAFSGLPFSLAIFSAAKRAIPVLHPFAWDVRLERIGRAMHGGRHAWQWLEPMIRDAPLMRATDWFYHVGWPFAIFGAGVVVSLLPPSAVRTRYLLASVLLWFIGGTVCALLLSSAGPPYFAAATGHPSPYVGLFAQLRASRIPCLVSQAALWNGFRRGVDHFGFGISAMPSVHVATATLLACLGWATDRRLGYVLIAGAVLTLVASVALGWHYALDGYVGSIVAIAIWIGCGRLLFGHQRGHDRTVWQQLSTE